MKLSLVFLVTGTCLTFASFSLVALAQNMWWNIPSEIPIMRPMEGLDFVLYTMSPILPLIGFGGIIILAVGAIIFFIGRKKKAV
ncbi:MAG TPA: hypothetical protein VLD38_09125 [Nitrosopumilaceae archaeon]|nr:hypothetical protein [Nitrosopumilaceae archaeon]